MQSIREDFYTPVHHIHNMDPNVILQILQTSAWKILNQEITSAETNNDCNPDPDIKKVNIGENCCGVDAFADLSFTKDVKRILDVGGGKFDYCHDFMKKRGIDLLVWDPYNRSQKHNAMVQKSVLDKKADAATSMAVLNVIAEPEARLAHINTLKEALSINGVAYFKIWPGEGILKGSYIPTVNSYGFPGYQANSYADRFLREVQLVFGMENAQIHPKIPNLIVAIKKSDKTLSLQEIIRIQKMSKNDLWLKRKKLYFQQFAMKHHLKLFFPKNGIFKKIENSVKETRYIRSQL